MNPAAQYTNLGTRFPRSLAGHSPNLKKSPGLNPNIATKVEEEEVGRRTERDRRTIVLEKKKKKNVKTWQNNLPVR